MNIPSSILTMIAGIGLTLISLWYGQNNGLMPVDASSAAPAVDNLFNVMVTLATGLFLLVQGILIVSAIVFRRRAGDNADAAPIHGNLSLEALWTALPAVIVMGLSIYSFDVYTTEMSGTDPMAHASHSKPRAQQVAQNMTHKMMDMSGAAIAAPLLGQKELDQKASTVLAQGNPPQTVSPAYEVNVTGLQFAWIFTYPSDGIVAGELHVPVGRPVHLNISANDVIHAFWVPEFRLKQDAIPGRQTELRFTATRPGEYPVICAELCGSYHGGMKTRVVAHTPEEFNQWIQSQKVASRDLLEQSIAINPTTLSESEFLAPYGQETGITQTTLHQVHSPHFPS